MHSDGQVLVIVPAFNEELSISSVVTELVSNGFTVLVVDDKSTDNTAQIAERCGAMVVRLSVNLGVGGALRTGFRFAVEHGYHRVVQVDGDGQHPVRQIPDLLKAAAAYGAHLVIGSRYLSSESTLLPSQTRKFAMRILALVSSRASGTSITDSTSGFRTIAEPLLSEFADSFPRHYLGDTFEAVVRAGRSGYRIIEIPAALRPRQFGQPTVGTARGIILVARTLIVALLGLRL